MPAATQAADRAAMITTVRHPLVTPISPWMKTTFRFDAVLTLSDTPVSHMLA
jgi:hypothetical protein